ncbi:MAG: hypothetical protein IPL58_14600 [Betaproteobacteria bacterium]|uniref:Uncharacterized protein n=1 Tax=Candidatus Proximibacter danicus TaxID=2954365 RepID=A0A9D7PSD0_9PROT|nr:hypothetical protein [Candidatus Proximibacter danicus]
MKPVEIKTGAQETRWFVRLLAGLALLTVIGAVREWAEPSLPPFKGRLAWIAELAFALAGSYGIIVLWLFAAIALVLSAKFVWRHTPRVPTDKWLW